MRDLQGLIDDGVLQYEGLGTLNKGADPAKIYRGEGLTLVLTEAGEFWTLLTSGEGMDLAIQMITE